MFPNLHHARQRCNRFVHPLDDLEMQTLQRRLGLTQQTRTRGFLTGELDQRPVHVHGRLFEDGQVAPEAVVQLPELFQRGHRCSRRCTRLLGVAELCEDVVHALGPGELDRECGEVEPRLLLFPFCLCCLCLCFSLGLCESKGERDNLRVYSLFEMNLGCV